ncbi:hypothetical protein Patl1_32984 [Pistacia atlantica]|uniref:Uncharacterized protein n=1 Tax=Pistacia atlantica TaxID=434234 RepID=A0ACC1AMC1_9ROSI|nr:hypothetical protein Patl1_32984 [Pistacia atlantica]
MLLQALLLLFEGKVDKVPHELQKAKTMLDEILSVLPLDGLSEAAVHATRLHCIFAFEEGQKFIGNQAKSKPVNFKFICPLNEDLVPGSSDSYLKAKAWLKLSNWLRRDYPDLSLENIVLKMCADFNMADISPFAGGGTSFVDEKLSSKPSVGVIIDEIVAEIPPERFKLTEGGDCESGICNCGAFQDKGVEKGLKDEGGCLEC